MKRFHQNYSTVFFVQSPTTVNHNYKAIKLLIIFLMISIAERLMHCKLHNNPVKVNSGKHGHAINNMTLHTICDGYLMMLQDDC